MPAVIAADYLYCRIALAEDKAQDVITCVDSARSRGSIAQVVSVPNDRVEDATYFSRESLGNMLLCLDYAARAHTFRGPIRERLTLVADFLRDSSFLAGHYKFSIDPAQDVLALCGKECISQLNLKAPAWQRMRL